MPDPPPLNPSSAASHDDTGGGHHGGGGGGGAPASTDVSSMPPPPQSAAAAPVVDGRELPFLVTHWLANYGLLSSVAAASSNSNNIVDNTNSNNNNVGNTNNSSNNNNNINNSEAIHRIHRAASELAAAFAHVGAFGTFQMPSLGQSHDVRNSSMFQQPSSVSLNSQNQNQNHNNQHATYADLRRRWSSSCPPDHLPRLLQAVAATNVTADATSTSTLSSSSSHQANLLNLSSEIRTQHNRNPESGRTLMESTAITTTLSTTTATTTPNVSVLQPPVLMAAANANANSAAAAAQEGGGAGPPRLSISSNSSFAQSACISATLMRRFLQLRDNVQQLALQIQTLQKSYQYQEETRVDLIKQRDEIMLERTTLQAQVTVPPGMILTMRPSSRANVQLDTIRDAQLQSERVMHSLERQLANLQTKYAADAAELKRAETMARQAFQASKNVLFHYRDPFLSTSLGGGGTAAAAAGHYGLAGNRIMLHIQARQVGLSRSCGGNNNNNAGGGSALLRQPLALGHSGARSTLTDLRKTLLYHRLSHAATINTHLNYPIYCLRFDQTGRYFVTGADDYLAKVFCLGDYVHGKTSTTNSFGGGGGGAMMDNAKNDEHVHRGAVLVCTLRGHAGVINDIDVSSDNALLATASEDGDCRVWGLANGCPIAILRGHVGGANMVKWSTLTPYRLVTAGADGLARTWDIKEACLKRYGKLVGKRAEYKRTVVPIRALAPVIAPPPPPAAAGQVVNLPPLPARQELGQGAAAAAAFLDAAAPPPILPLPPLPPPPPADVPIVPPPPLPPGAVAIGQVIPPPAAAAADGRFKAGDTIDEGVKLLSKMQHGASVDERLANSPGTRSRRAPVKVLCVALCPLGGHFVTGADDGICRVFSAADDEYVRMADLNLGKTTSIFNGDSGGDVHGARNKSSRRQAPPGKLLLSLKGHLSAVTDLQYSSGGDRILSASQKDGVVHLWSWSDDLLACGSSSSISAVSSFAAAAASPATGMTPNCHVSKILIKLTNPNAPAAEMGGGRSGARRRVNRASSAAITCDVACWVNDDSKVLTSQSQAAKQNEIQPGSQYFFLWDSITGHCLLGISGGHYMQCPVVIPHPMDVSIACSAGADGVVKFWDLETGSCVLSHKNTVDFGPVEPRDVGKISGYLDGSFSPDGTSLVLTDDCGRVTVFDSLAASPSTKESESGQRENPPWIKEQYFANDYYELYYDTHGYCVERGSERPPHLAPRGVRCSFSGAPWPPTVDQAFKALRGPLPCPENEARWKRLQLRSKSVMSGGQGVQRHRGNIVSQFEPQNTVMVGLDKKKPEAVSEENAATNQATRSPRLSSNWRWRDYSDVLREEGQDDEEDADDASYDADATNAARASRAIRRIARQNRPSQNDDDNDDSDSDMEDFETESLDRAATGAQPSRTSSRMQRQVYVDGQASSDEDDEIVSTHNTPSGPFIADYDNHYFRFPNEATADSIRRHWVHRTESTSSYTGRKCYTPQINDDVVYIPRAHADTIAQFPSLTAPWQSWPERAVWPVVRCRIRSLRYRFPFKAYFGGRSNRTGPRCESIVAILTLEVTGIPTELSDDRSFAWPKPSFVEQPSNGHTFQVSMFENEEIDFIIPLGLYQTRLTKLEESLSRNENAEVEAFYGSNERLDDGDFVPFRGTVVAHAAVDDDGDPNLCGSGYGSLTIQWEDGSEDHECSPWELDALESTTVSIQRPKLSVDEKKTVRKALSALRAMEGVKSLFDQPVNTRRCSDYESRVEVPMSLSFIKTRLDADYYATRLSVVADVALISINCWKYNGESELTQLAREMSGKFMDMVLSSAEKTSFLDFQAALVASAPQRAPDLNDDDEDGDADEPDTTQGARRSRRQASSRSALENLPPPAGRSTTVRSIRLRTSSQSTQRPRRDNNRSTRTGPSVLESQVVQPPPPGHLNGGNRGRATSNSSGQAPRGRQLRSASINVAAQAIVPNGNSRTAPGGNDDSPSAHTRGASRSAAGHVAAAPSLPRRAAEASSRTHQAPSPARGSPRGAAARSSRGAAATRRSLADDSSPEGENAESEYEQEEEEDDDPSSDHHVVQLATRTRRSSRRSSARGAAAESSQDDNSDSDASETEQRRPARASRPRSSRAAGAAAGPTSGRAARRSSQPSPPASRRSRRNDHVDDDDFSNENGSVEENQRRRSNQLESPGSPRRSSRGQHLKQSFVDPGSSEFSDNFDEDDDSEEEEEKRPKKRGKASSTKAQKKKAALKRPPPSQGKRPSKRRKKKNSDDDDDDDEDLNEDEQRPWPTIDIKQITKVGTRLLEKLRDLDSDDVFAVPVTEAFPEVFDSYGEVIDQPMDFRTIEEERLPIYQSILEFQDDLTLVFRNCIQYNNDDPKSPYVGLAKLMLSVMEEEFIGVCEQLNVRVQRPAAR